MGPESSLTALLLVSAAVLSASGSTVPRNSSSESSSAHQRPPRSEHFEQDCLAAHNRYRQLHRTNDLQIDPAIVAFAQRRADQLAVTEVLQHPPNLPYGENLAWHSSESTSCEELVQMWYDEVSMYDFSGGSFSMETGHFTQLVWKSSERVGCARSFGQRRGGVYLVCNYDPAGNVMGRFQRNVFPAGGRPQGSEVQETVRKPVVTNKPITHTVITGGGPHVSTSPFISGFPFIGVGRFASSRHLVSTGPAAVSDELEAIERAHQMMIQSGIGILSSGQRRR